MIGLKNDTVQLVPYDSDWKNLFEIEKGIIVNIFGTRIKDIQHVGSTAIEGLVAKPIIDIATGINNYNENIANIVKEFVKNGYKDKEDQKDDGGYLIAKEENDIRTVHIHIVEHGAPLWNVYLSFRDRLRNDPKILKQYAELKLNLAKQYPSERLKYTKSKDKFIKSILNKYGSA
jgi:GrpB-like predicted nucleotidyltransferase (UPF0157 family)